MQDNVLKMGQQVYHYICPGVDPLCFKEKGVFLVKDRTVNQRF